MKKQVLFISILLLFVGCQRDKLEGDASILVGKWKWTHTREIKVGWNGTFFDTIYAANFDNTYEIEFLRKGKAVHLRNDTPYKDHPIRFSILRYSDKSFYPLTFIISSEKKSEFLGGSLSASDMMCEGQELPLIEQEDNQYAEYHYQHFYKKVQ